MIATDLKPIVHFFPYSLRQIWQAANHVGIFFTEERILTAAKMWFLQVQQGEGVWTVDGFQQSEGGSSSQMLG